MVGGAARKKEKNRRTNKKSIGSGSPMSQSFPLAENEDNVTISLDGNMNVGSAQALRDRLLEALGRDKKLLLDGRSVELVSTAAVQLLLAGSREAEESGIGFGLIEPSPVLVGALEGLGFSEELKRWSAQ
jgi:anti-anti-sigma regulatory factor